MKSAALAFSGQISSGKTTISLGVSNALGWKYASFGNYVRKVALQRKIPNPSRGILQEIGIDLINQGWPNFCFGVLADAKWIKGDSLVIDGIRHVDALKTLREILHPMNVYLIYVNLREEIRETRLSKVGVTPESLRSFDQHLTEMQVQKVLK